MNNYDYIDYYDCFAEIPFCNYKNMKTTTVPRKETTNSNTFHWHCINM
jgi:hypothetical protein